MIAPAFATMADVIEHDVRRAPLALRITDLTTGRPVPDGLTVTAWPSADPSDVRVATVTARGIAGWHRLAGCDDYEWARAPRDEWFDSPPTRPSVEIVARVTDSLGRYLPVIRQLTAPAAHAAPVGLSRTSNAGVPAGHLSLVATVVDEVGAVALGAVVEVEVGSFRTGAVTDARGVALLAIPRAVPPSSPGTATDGPTWNAVVRVRWRPAGQVRAAGTTADDPAELGSLLAQPLAAIVRADSTTAASAAVSLAAARTAVARSDPSPHPPALVVRPTP